MTAEDIWKSQPEFQKYPLINFKKYNRNMKILVSKKVKLAATEDAIYLEDMQRHPQKQITCRGTPFWSEHAAKKMLDKDLKDGIGQNMKPKELWMSRREYQYFPYNYFCKRVHKVRYKQLAAPYWQVERNKNGRALHRLETDEMRKKWADGEDFEEMISMFKQGSI